MIRLSMLVGGLAVYLGARYLARRRGRSVVRLRDGRQVRLVSSVALLNGSPGDMLALEYLSTLPDPPPDEVELEARKLIQTVGARAEYAACRVAVVTARRRGERPDAPAPEELIFTFRRGDSAADWYPTEGLE